MLNPNNRDSRDIHMTYPISHAIWQTLRVLTRSKHPVIGRDLRISWTRYTKDGTFLTELIRIGLLNRVSGTDEKPFEATYVLTEAGKYAADYGEYECDRDHIAIPAAAPNPPTDAKPEGKQKAR